ncbi:MAG: minor capsid protein [Planctomycetota bacterium]|jgi:hypothetical protein
MLLNDVATWLDAQSTAFTLLAGTAGNLVKAHMQDSPPAPDTLVGLFETAGTSPVHVFTTSSQTRNYEQTGLQVLVRSSSYQTARNLAETAYTLLDGLAGTNLPTATGPSYLSVAAIQNPFSIGRDDNERYVMSCNFDVWKTTG